ncbi:hypothetical protein [Leisingera thetidis]|uniref:hypothetical protein n=1 Tax=Leisingera thetidis TaxID=2930199 RepID=UPI0021F728D7|nr:hypothetical protein [Leisingera thetidis]
MRHYEKTHFDTASQATTLTPGDYVRLLHPEEAIGKTTLMSKDGSDQVHSKTYDLATASALVDNFLDGDGYISLHRFHGARRVGRLAALNGLFLDLDADRLPVGATRAAGPWSLDVLMRLVSMNLPEPTVLMSTGRGLAAIWLLDPLPPQALPRWQPAQNALIDLFRCLGADPSCRDAARVTRLPGSLNSKSRTIATIIGGTLERFGFDKLADEIYIAAGRPTREELHLHQERKKGRVERKAHSGGLTVSGRFQAIARDLERLLLSWGGQVPVGFRNTWLHLYATCLSHTSDERKIPGLVETMAAQATPGLTLSEVAGIAKIAARHASLPSGCTPLTDGRYHYSGATVAELLDVTAAGARALGLEQVMPKEERAKRKAERERLRRRTAGVMSRQEWLQKNSQERQKPWIELGISRSTFYRRLRAGQIVEPPKPTTATEVETGPCPQQGGSALPKASAERHSPSAKDCTPTKRPRRRTQPTETTRKGRTAAPPREWAE